MKEPIIISVHDLAENIYSASGTKSGCKSIYMKGEYQQPSYNPIEDGYKIGRGCEGCPAWSGNSCRFISEPEQMNWDGDFRPSWEVQGHKPDEKGY